MLVVLVDTYPVGHRL